MVLVEGEIGGIKLTNLKAKSSTIALPATIEDISADFLTAALAKRFPGVVVEDFAIVFTHHGFTTILRLDLDLNAAGKAAGCPSRLILKGGFEPVTHGIVKEMAVGAFLSEVGSYTQVAPYLGLNMPECYFAEVDLEQKQMIVLMEDLVLRNARFCKGTVPHTVEQVRRRLTSLAGFHARSWNHAELEDGGRWSIFPGNAARLFRNYMKVTGYDTPETWARIVEKPRAAACAVKFHDRDWVLRTMDFMAAHADAGPICMVHGDLHSGNLFEEEDGTPGFYDSLPMRTAPMIDISYFITNTLDHRDRREHERALVDHYRRELIANGADAPSLEDLMYQFAIYLPFGFATFFVNETSYQTESFNTAHAARYSVAMLDHNTRGLIP